MPSSKGTNFTPVDREARLRHKLVNNEMNPIVDAVLTVVLLCMTPFIWIFAMVHDKLMFKFLNKTYIYNVSWEDPRMDQRVFDLNETDHVVTIASAGCNVLDYIIEGAMVTAVDFNLCQIALTELKKVAILNVEYDVFFEIFSKSNMAVLKEIYPTKLRPFLTAPSQEFWDDGVNSIKSFMYSGTSGNMSYLLFRILFPIFGLGFIRKEIMKKTPKEELLKKIINSSYSIRGIAWLMDNIMLRGGCCLAGVPERQMALGLHRPNNLALVIERIFFKTDLVNDNYFYAGYLLGYYTPENCPRYLRKENYAKMRKHLQNDKLILVHGTMLSAIDNSTVPITVASLLDHMDWMTDRMINEEITHLIKKMDPVRGKIFWRTFADDVHSAPLNWLEPVRVDDFDDRVGMYWTTWISYLKDVKVNYEERIDTQQKKSSLDNFLTGIKVVTFPLWRPIATFFLRNKSSNKEGEDNTHKNNMEGFYKYQKQDYDSFREDLLHGKAALMESLPLKKAPKDTKTIKNGNAEKGENKGEKGELVWVDVGGGTARNLEYLTLETIRRNFKKIYILDISASLLEVARKRVAALGLEDIVTVIEHDFTDSSVFTVMPSIGTADIVTFSYSYSMIPKQAIAMQNASKLLKAGGIIAIADFFQKGNYDDCLPPLSKRARAFESLFHQKWFAMDHVHLLGDKQLELGGPEMVPVWDNRFRGSVPFLPFLQPFHGVYVLRKK